MNCAYCEAGIAEKHNHQGQICATCGDEVTAVDSEGKCALCIMDARITQVIERIER